MSGYYGQYEDNDLQSTDGINEYSVGAKSSPLLRVGIVTKVFTDPTNLEYDVGTIQFRFLTGTEAGMDGVSLDRSPDANMPYARPCNASMVSIPAMNEYVYIMHGPYDISDRPDQLERDVTPYYYSNPIMMKGDIHHNASERGWLKKFIDSSKGLTMEVPADYEANLDTPPPEEDNEDERIALGNDLHKQVIMTPHMFEGDVNINGRFGQSIKLSATVSEGAGETWRGTADLTEDPQYQKPITIIRNGLPEGVTDRYVDNVATDPSAIWLTNGQYIPELKDLTPFDRSLSLNIGELFEHANLGTEVNQCIIRSDRIMSIARREIYNWSERGISLATRGAITIDGSQILLEAATINLGSGAGDQESDRDLQMAVRGENLQKILLEILSAFSTTTVTTPAGPGTLNPTPTVSQMYDDVLNGQEQGLFSKKVFLE